MVIAKFGSGKGTSRNITTSKIVKGVKTVEREIKSVRKSVAVAEPVKRPPELSDLKPCRQCGLTLSRFARIAGVNIWRH